MKLNNLLLTLIPNLSSNEANMICTIINTIYGICIGLMIISVIYYTGMLFWKIHHAQGDEEIKFLKKMYIKRIVAFGCFLLLFVIVGIVLGVLGPLIKSDTNAIGAN